MRAKSTEANRLQACSHMSRLAIRFAEALPPLCASGIYMLTVPYKKQCKHVEMGFAVTVAVRGRSVRGRGVRGRTV